MGDGEIINKIIIMMIKENFELGSNWFLPSNDFNYLFFFSSSLVFASCALFEIDSPHQPTPPHPSKEPPKKRREKTISFEVLSQVAEPR